MRASLLTFLLACVIRAYAGVILPTPQSVTPLPGEFRTTDSLSVKACNKAQKALALFNQHIAPLVTATAAPQIIMEENDTLSAEAYTLAISQSRIVLQASTEAGFIYGVQSLRQWGNKGNDGWTFPCVNIIDRPRLKWRAFMLDSGRQFQPVDTIKKYIDMASALKMNCFHWHLTEGLGWRAEIKEYPELTKTGAFVGKGPEQQGFYTRADMEEVVRYAAARGVNIMPEIDIPGHAEAALYAYPLLGCTNQKPPIPETGFTPNIFCAGSDFTVVFLKRVLLEICDIFPFEYIHLGGDEAPKDNWDSCPKCRMKVRKLGLKDSHQLQLWLSAELANHLATLGRKAVFYDDLVNNADGFPLPNNVVIQWWNYRTSGDKGLMNALRHGYEVICATNYYCYLNFPETPWKGYGPERTFDIFKAYLDNPSDRAAQCSPLVLGITASLWTDYALTMDLLDYRLYPRIYALAEQMWHVGERLPMQQFLQKIREHNAQSCK